MVFRIRAVIKYKNPKEFATETYRNKSQFTHINFVDASQKAYGAVICERIEYEDQMMSMRLVAAKTKVAPIQSV